MSDIEKIIEQRKIADQSLDDVVTQVKGATRLVNLGLLERGVQIKQEEYDQSHNDLPKPMNNA